jgi:predicted phage-related endonuclease
MLANLDGICQHPIYGPCLFEAKTTSVYNSDKWDDDAIPDDYVLQVQHYMAVTGFMGAFVTVLIGGNTFKWRFIERDDELISMLVRLEADFWDHIESNTPPPLDGSEATADFLKDRFPDSMPNEAADLIRQYDTANELVEQHTEQRDHAANLLKQMLGDHETGTVGDTVVSYKKYSNKTSYRRFSIKSASNES